MFKSRGRNKVGRCHDFLALGNRADKGTEKVIDRHSDTGDQQSAGSRDLPTIECHAHSIEVVERAEGYREFRCTPSFWTYPDQQVVESLAAEALGENRGVDKYGWGEAVEFWSGSDACLRLAAVSPSDLQRRELTALATRRSVGLNAPRPWLSGPLIQPIEAFWRKETGENEQGDTTEETDEEWNSIWDHYGMHKSIAEPIIFSYGMRQSDRIALGRIGRPWQGGMGTWYRWSTMRAWTRWPRRQEIQGEAVTPDPGHLLLFISHRWECLDHPDPTGAQLRCLQIGLLFSLAKAVLSRSEEEEAEFKTGSGLPEVLHEFLDAEFTRTEIDALVPWAQAIRRAGKDAEREEAFVDAIEVDEPEEILDRIRSRILIWYDYCSMLQAPRTASEESAFRAEILTLNDIQAVACTVVIAGDSQYLFRAWCFLELCGGMRHRIAELTPSWGTRVGLGDSVTRWAHRSDQLISALATHGLDALSGSGLESTRPEDLPDIARLLARLDLTGLLATDDSDLVGGSLPVPFDSGAWEISGSSGEIEVDEHDGGAIEDFGRLPDRETLTELGTDFSGVDSLAGSFGVWVYTTNRALSLAWAGRVSEWWTKIRSLLSELPAVVEPNPLPAERPEAIACLWADSMSLSDDASGWTRAIPSTVELLVILTQADIPKICKIYEAVVATHNARGVTVVTFCPENGKLLVHRPDESPQKIEPGWAVDVLAVPRLRRNSAHPNQLFLPAASRLEDVEVLAALRLDPGNGLVPEGRVHVANEDGTYSVTEEVVDASWLIRNSDTRTRIEGLARAVAGTWNEFLSRLVHQKYWVGGVVPKQLSILEELLAHAMTASEVPYLRGRYLEYVLEDSTKQGTLLPDWILDDAKLQAQAFRDATTGQ
jgi:hypothetical protein